jgi:hypothetical protein
MSRFLPAKARGLFYDPVKREWVDTECLVDVDNVAMFIKDHKTGKAGVVLQTGRIVWLDIPYRTIGNRITELCSEDV